MQRAQRLAREELNELSKEIIGLAIKVHRTLGPGFTEKIYEKALIYELRQSGKKVSNQSTVKVKYGPLELGNQRVDLIIEGKIIVELKSVSELNEIHKAQLISYLKTADGRLGLILNFAKKRLEVKRIVNKF